MNDELLELLGNMENFSAFVDSSEIPNIGLYMDQVTTFMNTYLSGSKRTPSDKTLTKTMINNYAKDGLFPSPDKKKYSKDHMLLLLLIYHFKNNLSITDIGTLLHPVSDELFHTDKTFTLQDLYDTMGAWSKKRIDELKADILDNLSQADELAKEADEISHDTLKRFYFLAMLGVDIYFKKQIMERMLDQMATDENTEKAAKKKNKDK